jgi:hypothetical protein
MTKQEKKPNRHGYNAKSVDEAINASNRHRRRISKKEARLIHALLKGRG